MIGKLTGNIDFLQDDKCIIDVNGVGYVVFISNKTASFLRPIKNSTDAPKKQAISLTIETVVKEDAIELYGFATEIERLWFMQLTKVQGVGAKMGLKILAHFTIDELIKALIEEDTKEFSKISGIGPKLAKRITTELKEAPKKLGANIDFAGTELGSAAKKQESQVAVDALSALENLGYKKAESLKAINEIIKGKKDVTLENLITSALRSLGR